MRTSIFLAIAYLLSHTATVSAGSIEGKITFDSKPPFAGLFYFRDKGAKGGKFDIDQKDKEFVQKVFPVTVGSKVEFHNSDNMDHNIYASSMEDNIKFDIGILPPGANQVADNASWKEDSVFRIGCKIHPKMKAYIANIPSSHYAAIDFDKQAEHSFKINNVPADQTTLVVWMPKYDDIEINIKPGEEKTVELLRSGKVRGTLTVKRN